MFPKELIPPTISQKNLPNAKGVQIHGAGSLCTRRQACRSHHCKSLQGPPALLNLPPPPMAEEDIFRHCLVPQQQKELGAVQRTWEMGGGDAGQKTSWGWRGSLRVKEEEDEKMQTGSRNVVCKAGCEWDKKELSLLRGGMAERKEMGKHRNVNLIPSSCKTQFLVLKWWKLSDCIISVLLILSENNTPKPCVPSACRSPRRCNVFILLLGTLKRAVSGGRLVKSLS